MGFVMSNSRPSNEASMDFIRQVLARDTEVRDDIVARIESDRFVDVLGRRSTAMRARRIVESAESASAGPAFPDAAAQAVVLFDIRPSLLVRGDSFELSASTVWRDRLIEAEPAIRKAIPSVGQVAIKDHPHPRIAELAHIGSAWMISENVAVTNRHVARTFGFQAGQDVRFWSDSMSVRIDFHCDRGNGAVNGFHVARILEITQDAEADIAFLQFAASPDLPEPVILDEHYEDEFIVTVGYPEWDPQIPPEMVRHVLNDVYDAKRMAPGRIVDAGTESVFRHDASTLKGSSGSMVLSLETGHAVGLQISGGFSAENQAVTTARLKERLSALALTVQVPSAGNGEAYEIGSRQIAGEPEGPSGYDPAFLGVESSIPMPGLDCPQARTTSGLGTELAYNRFSIVMHETRRLAIAAACNIDGSRLKRIPRKGGFVIDRRLANEHQWDDGLYRHNPYDRGQLIGRCCAAWGDRRTASRANDDTFFFTNTVPQHAQLNRRLWQGLEDHVLDHADAFELRASVFAGCVFDDADPVYRDAKLPRQFWKIVAFTRAHDTARRIRACGFLMDQSHLMRNVQDSFAFGAFKTYQLPIAEIAMRTGLDLGVLAGADVLGDTRPAGPRPISQFSDIVI